MLFSSAIIILMEMWVTFGSLEPKRLNGIIRFISIRSVPDKGSHGVFFAQTLIR